MVRSSQPHNFVKIHVRIFKLNQILTVQHVQLLLGGGDNLSLPEFSAKHESLLKPTRGQCEVIHPLKVEQYTGLILTPRLCCYPTWMNVVNPPVFLTSF